MVQFGVSTVEEAMNLGREAADFISGTFIKVGAHSLLSLVFCPYHSYIIHVIVSLVVIFNLNPSGCRFCHLNRPLLFSVSLSLFDWRVMMVSTVLDIKAYLNTPDMLFIKSVALEEVDFVLVSKSCYMLVVYLISEMLWLWLLWVGWLSWLLYGIKWPILPFMGIMTNNRINLMLLLFGVVLYCFIYLLLYPSLSMHFLLPCLTVVHLLFVANKTWIWEGLLSISTD